MPVDPADQTVRVAISDILSKFLTDRIWSQDPLATLAQQAHEKYTLGYVDGQTLRGVVGKSSELEFKAQGRFLYLEPVVDKGILPFLTFDTSNDWVNFRAYVLLTMLDPSNDLQALAMRFETDEGSRADGRIGSHDFCHAQLCRSINSARATTPPWLPESQPSVPLDADDQIGLVLCMLTSVYGGRHVVDRLNVSGDRKLRKHLEKVRALSSSSLRQSPSPLPGAMAAEARSSGRLKS